MEVGGGGSVDAPDANISVTSSCCIFVVFVITAFSPLVCLIPALVMRVLKTSSCIASTSRMDAQHAATHIVLNERGLLLTDKSTAAKLLLVLNYF